jgi:ABC-type spermidine/putrescine transport system permease subunit II
MEFPPPGYSLQWFRHYFGSSDWINPTLVSLEVATVTMVFATVIGTLAALALVKKRVRFHGALVAFLLSPIIVPSIIIAVAFYFQFASFGLVGTRIGLILAHLVLSTPFVVIVVMGTLQNVDPSHERAARSLGAGPFRAFWRVVLPLIWPGIFTAAFFAFLASFDEVIVAVFLSGTSAATLPKRLLDATQHEFRPTIAAVSVFLIMLSILVVLGADILQAASRRVTRVRSELADGRLGAR